MSHFSNILNIAAIVVALYSLHQVPSLEPNLTVQTWLLPLLLIYAYYLFLADLSMIDSRFKILFLRCILQLTHTANSAVSWRIHNMAECCSLCNYGAIETWNLTVIADELDITHTGV